MATRKPDSASFTLLILGDSQVGKTSLISKIAGGDATTTGDISYVGRNAGFMLGSQHISLTLIELVFASTGKISKVVDAVVVVYDVCSSRSFENVNEWIGKGRQYSPSSLVFLVGNKIDVKSERCVQEEKARALMAAERLGGYVEVSGRTGANVVDLFIAIAQKLTNERERKNINEKDFDRAMKAKAKFAEAIHRVTSKKTDFPLVKSKRRRKPEKTQRKDSMSVDKEDDKPVVIDLCKMEEEEKAKEQTMRRIKKEIKVRREAEKKKRQEMEEKEKELQKEKERKKFHSFLLHEEPSGPFEGGSESNPCSPKVLPLFAQEVLPGSDGVAKRKRRKPISPSDTDKGSTTATKRMRSKTCSSIDRRVHITCPEVPSVMNTLLGAGISLQIDEPFPKVTPKRVKSASSVGMKPVGNLFPPLDTPFLPADPLMDFALPDRMPPTSASPIPFQAMADQVAVLEGDEDLFSGAVDMIDSILESISSIYDPSLNTVQQQQKELQIDNMQMDQLSLQQQQILEQAEQQNNNNNNNMNNVPTKGQESPIFQGCESSSSEGEEDQQNGVLNLNELDIAALEDIINKVDIQSDPIAEQNTTTDSKPFDIFHEEEVDGASNFFESGLSDDITSLVDSLLTL